MNLNRIASRRLTPALLLAALALSAQARPVLPQEGLTITIALQKEQPLTAAEKQDLQKTIQAAVQQSLREKSGGESVRIRFVQDGQLPEIPTESREELLEALAIQRQIRDEMARQLLIYRKNLEEKIDSDPIAVHLKLIIRRLEDRFHDLAEIFEGNLIKAHEVEDTEEHLLAARIELARHIRSLQQGPESQIISELQQQIFQRTIRITELEMQLRQFPEQPGGPVNPAPSDEGYSPPPQRHPNLKVASK